MLVFGLPCESEYICSLREHDFVFNFNLYINFEEMDLVKLCISPFCSCVQSPVVRQDMSYVFHTKEKLDDLEGAMKDLMVKKQGIRRQLDDPQNKGKQPSDEVQRWLEKVREKDDKVKELLEKYSKSSCVAGSCSLNCFSRYKISRDAIKLFNEINQLKGEQSSEISLKEISSPVPVPVSYRTVGKGIGINVDIARSYLQDEAVGMVGIWGMGGVGKTTLLRKVYNSLLEDGSIGFDHVLFIEAEQNIQLGELREKIAKMLQLPSSIDAEDIFKVLKTKNFVLLLDNIWEDVDLAYLGIPHPYSNDISTKHCKHKVIFTTRSEDVCARMGAKARIKMECLERDEAWGLFKDNVNLDVIESDERIKNIAKQVMNMCGRLPLALKVIGKAMSNKKTLQEWDFVLTSLKNSRTEMVQGMKESLFPIMKFSYNNLPDNIKECFLYAAMLRGKRKDKLVEGWMGLGLIGDFDNLQEAYGKAENILKILEESCLLHQDSKYYYTVELHDVIYEMAMWIASDCGMNMNKWILKRNVQLEEIPTNEVENWRFANRVILDNVGIKVLPVLSHRCSELLCLVISNNKYLQNIPKGFFRQMPNLVYLNLSSSSIEELPKDIQYLVDLQYLNISDTKISSLPNELQKLKNLQYLICRSVELGKLQNGLISKFPKLKVLDLYPHGWIERQEELKKLKKHIKAVGMRVASHDVLQQLSCLPTTRVSIQNIDNLISLSFDTLSCKNHGFLHELKIESCPHLEELVMNGSQTHLSELSFEDVQELRKIIWKEVSPQDFLHKLKFLSIQHCNLASFAWVLHLPCLSHLAIMNCGEIEKLFYVEEEEGEIQQILKGPMFPSLRFLILHGLTKLVSISNVALDFPELLSLKVETCPNLKKLLFKRGIINNKPCNIFCARKWWKSLEWDDATIPSYLSPIFFEII